MVPELIPQGKIRSVVIVQDYKIPFHVDPIHIRVLHGQKNECRSFHFSESRNRKHVAERCHSESVTCFKRVFKQPVSDGGKRPVINLKNLNSFIQYQHFKMEGLILMKYLLQEGDYMCKIDLSDAYFTMPINQKYRKHLRFKSEGTLYDFLCLYFRLSTTSLILTNLMNVPIALLRRLHICLNNITGRHGDNGQVSTEIDLSSRH